MIGIEAPLVSPHGKFFYSGIALFALAAGSFFAFETFTVESTPFGWRLVIAGLALVFLFGAAQAFERLVRPEKACACSSALSSSMRRSLLAARRTLVVLSLAGFVIAASKQWMAHAADIADIDILSGASFFIAYCLADLSGERLSSRVRSVQTRSVGR